MEVVILVALRLHPVTLVLLYVEFRVDEATEDYTGLGRPGVWFLGPVARGSVARELRAL